MGAVLSQAAGTSSQQQSVLICPCAYLPCVVLKCDLPSYSFIEIAELCGLYDSL
jgi:hypothetical protein